jgi:uncharacterized protein involved in type VI secretion and phage assembly
MNDRLNPAGYTDIAALAEPTPARKMVQCRKLAGGRRLGDETFRLVRFSGQDGASELFEYQLELHGNTSVRHGAALEYEDLIGRALTVGIQCPAPHEPTYPLDVGYSSEEMVERFQQVLDGGPVPPELVVFNGIVAAFAMEQRGVYRVSMKPAMHRLTLTNQYKVYPLQSALDVVRGLLKQHHVDCNTDALADRGNAFSNRSQNWLQAGESDFDFLRRLMGKAHVYFYFTHSGVSHCAVFANRAAYAQVYADGRPLRYTYTGSDELGLGQDDVIFQYNYQCALTSSSVRGVLARQVSCWEEDPIARVHTYGAATDTEPGELPFTQYKVIQYGGSPEEADAYTDATGNTMQAAAQVFSGASYCARFRSGHQFVVSGEMLCPGDEPIQVRPALDGQRFVLTQVKHEASADGAYQNQFQSCPASGLIAPFSMQETQQGAVLAEVVAPPGEVPPDWRYYAANCFGVETLALSDPDETVQALGVYVRLSTDPAGAAPCFIKLAPHMQTVPEPGVTVLVARAQDESELPEIQSIIHSNGTKVIMPSGWTAGSHVGSSYNTSYGDGKNIRFGLRSQPLLPFAVNRVSATYDTGNFRETSYSQGASYSYSCAESLAASPGNDAELYGKYAGAPDLLSASESFGSNYSRHHGSVASSYANIGTSYNVSVTGLSENHSTVTGKSISTALHQGDVSSDTTINADSTSTATHLGDVSSTSSHLGDVGSTTTIIGNQTSVSIIAGINASSATHAVTLSNNNTVMAGSINLTGVTMGMHMTGISVNDSTTGVSSNESSTGVHSETSSFGVQSSVSDTGYRDTVSFVGASSTVELKGPGIHYTNQAEQVGAATKDIDVITIALLRVYM